MSVDFAICARRRAPRRSEKLYLRSQSRRGKNKQICFFACVCSSSDSSSRIWKEMTKKYWNNQHPMINFMQILCQFNLKRFQNSGAFLFGAKELQTKSYHSTNMKNLSFSTPLTLAHTNYLPIMHQCRIILNFESLSTDSGKLSFVTWVAWCFPMMIGFKSFEMRPMCHRNLIANQGILKRVSVESRNYVNRNRFSQMSECCRFIHSIRVSPLLFGVPQRNTSLKRCIEKYRCCWHKFCLFDFVVQINSLGSRNWGKFMSTCVEFFPSLVNGWKWITDCGWWSWAETSADSANKSIENRSRLTETKLSLTKISYDEKSRKLCNSDDILKYFSAVKCAWKLFCRKQKKYVSSSAVNSRDVFLFTIACQINARSIHKSVAVKKNYRQHKKVSRSH